MTPAEETMLNALIGDRPLTDGETSSNNYDDEANLYKLIGKHNTWILECTEFMSIVETSLRGNGEFVRTACDRLELDMPLRIKILVELNMPLQIEIFLDHRPWAEDTREVLAILLTARCLLERSYGTLCESLFWGVQASYCLETSTYADSLVSLLELINPVENWQEDDPGERTSQILNKVRDIVKSVAKFRIALEQLDGKRFLVGVSPRLITHQVSSPMMVFDRDYSLCRKFEFRAALLHNGTQTTVYPNEFLTFVHFGKKIITHLQDTGYSSANTLRMDRLKLGRQ